MPDAVLTKTDFDNGYFLLQLEPEADQTLAGRVGRGHGGCLAPPPSTTRASSTRAGTGRSSRCRGSSGCSSSSSCRCTRWSRWRSARWTRSSAARCPSTSRGGGATAAFRQVLEPVLRRGRLLAAHALSGRSRYVAIASIICLLIGYTVAYYVARYGGRRKTLFLVLLISPFWISYLMRIFAWQSLLQTDGYVNDILHAVPPDRDAGRLALGQTDHGDPVPRLRLRPVHDPARCTDSSTGSTRACSRPAAISAPARRRRSSGSRFRCRDRRSWRG